MNSPYKRVWYRQVRGAFVKQALFLPVNHRGPLLLIDLHSAGETIVWRDPGILILFTTYFFLIFYLDIYIYILPFRALRNWKLVCNAQSTMTVIPEPKSKQCSCCVCFQNRITKYVSIAQNMRNCTFPTLTHLNRRRKSALYYTPQKGVFSL